MLTNDDKLARIDIRMSRLSLEDPQLFADIMGICREIAQIPADADRDLYPDDDIVQDLSGLPASITHADILAWHAWRAGIEDIIDRDFSAPVVMVA